MSFDKYWPLLSCFKRLGPLADKACDYHNYYGDSEVRNDHLRDIPLFKFSDVIAEQGDQQKPKGDVEIDCGREWQEDYWEDENQGNDKF